MIKLMSLSTALVAAIGGCLTANRVLQPGRRVQAPPAKVQAPPRVTRNGNSKTNTPSLVTKIGRRISSPRKWATCGR